MTIRDIGGRPAIDRAGLAQRWGISLAALDLRIAKDHPPATISGATTDRRRKWWWWLDEADHWMQEIEDRKRATLTRVDRSGDPEELVTAPVAARVIGYSSHRNLPGDLLDWADEVTELPSGNKRRRWRRRTLWAFADQRNPAGGGAPPGNANPLGPARRQVDRTGNPDELLNPAETARVLGYARPESLPSALRERADETEELPSGRKRRYWRRRTLWAFADDSPRQQNAP